MGLFPGFTDERLAVNSVEIQAVVGGSGPPLLLLHGAPQSHVMWHHIAPRLAERFTVVATDLRGYSDSSKPPGGGDRADTALATAYFHWFFFIQPAPLPELMMQPTAGVLLKALLGAFGGTDCYDPEAMAEYERCFATPESIHAMCEDYRAAATIDLAHDAADEGRTVHAQRLHINI